MTEAATFTCSICSEPSTDICVGCTKDACWNHRCERCKRCSDCCECDVPLTPREPQIAQPVASEPVPEPGMAAESMPEAFPTGEPDSAPAEAWLSEPEAEPELDSSWLAPPEASEEPDLNTPPVPIFEETVEHERLRPFPTNSRDERGGTE